MSKKVGYYKDKAGDTWLRMGKVAIVYEARTAPGISSHGRLVLADR
jgi:hypothetical protein